MAKRLYRAKWTEEHNALVIAENDEDALLDEIEKGNYFDDLLEQNERHAEITDENEIAGYKEKYPEEMKKLEEETPEESDTEKEEAEAEES